MISVGPEVLAALARYDTPTLSNAIETFDVRPRDEGFTTRKIHCMFPDMKPIVGLAATATIRTNEPPITQIEQLQVWRHVQSVPAPRVLVVQDLDQPTGHGAQFGEVQGAIFKALGCVAIVTDGTVRDLEEVRATGLQMFARGRVASHAYAHFTSTGSNVVVGGLLLGPGDIIHADRHGVLLVPNEIAERLPEAADRIIAREQKLIAWIRSDAFDVEKLEEMRRVDH